MATTTKLEKIKEPILRMIVREIALGLTDDDVAVNHPEYSAGQIARMRTGRTFQAAVAEMQARIDEELVSTMAEDPTRRYLASNTLNAAKTIVRLALDDDGETPHAVQAKAAADILDRTGYSKRSEQDASVPVLLLSPEKFRAVMAGPNPLADIPDLVDGHSGLDK
jgi:hypothetical protein